MDSARRRRIEERVAREIVLLLLLAAVAAAQTTLLPRWLGAPPNVLLLLVVVKSILTGPAAAARWAFYGGIALDLCAGSLLGSHALALLAAVLAATLPLARMSQSNWLLPLLGVTLGAAGYHAVLWAQTTLLVAPISAREYATILALPDLLVALIPALPLFLVARWLRGRSRGEVPIDVY